jgi:pteridine reductase
MKGYPRAVETTAPVALVTGAAVRLGRVIAEGLAAAGYRVWIHHHASASAAAQLCASLRGAGHDRALGPIAADLRDAAARAELCARVTDRGGPAAGRLDLLVNSAASFERGRFADRSDDDLLRVLTLNLVAPLSLARTLAPALAASGGSILNMVDLGALEPWPEYLDHGVAKAGLHHATEGLAVELAPVRVNAIAPGSVLPPDDLDAAGRAALRGRVPGGAPATPEAVADAVIFLARAVAINGHTLVVDAGQHAARGGLRPRSP